MNLLSLSEGLWWLFIQGASSVHRLIVNCTGNYNRIRTLSVIKEFTTWFIWQVLSYDKKTDWFHCVFWLPSQGSNLFRQLEWCKLYEGILQLSGMLFQEGCCYNTGGSYIQNCHMIHWYLDDQAPMIQRIWSSLQMLEQTVRDLSYWWLSKIHWWWRRGYNKFSWLVV